jgi:hypothetical protein
VDSHNSHKVGVVVDKEANRAPVGTLVLEEECKIYKISVASNFHKAYKDKCKVDQVVWGDLHKEEQVWGNHNSLSSSKGWAVAALALGFKLIWEVQQVGQDGWLSLVSNNHNNPNMELLLTECKE